VQLTAPERRCFANFQGELKNGSNFPQSLKGVGAASDK
jgi:hypothetical protein